MKPNRLSEQWNAGEVLMLFYGNATIMASLMLCVASFMTATHLAPDHDSLGTCQLEVSYGTQGAGLKFPYKLQEDCL
ncbi:MULTISPECIES: hypothetical protein [Shewanella]|uniref:Uncharacterized protein n=1 Tax=Shewanella japonica TaxID=93973 RepID=A0ABN4YHC3_9GAMM|nr:MULTISPECIES: hypothetical protein [Shewanella]ARD22449.1 hypothetical protein SJ2017_2151 [Shewanella japonica]KPZ70728.1 hypothetical protein AN944_02164 [Shewanella sp. P1-14-1]MBQ4888913.1 hypothetical protein [Shewanella sp. MMG014]OBT11396.1 hypothetical protein A9267_01755 [Shewanella sp. UCD-FRSSP16_17]